MRIIRLFFPSVAESALCAAGVGAELVSEPSDGPTLPSVDGCGPCSNVILNDSSDIGDPGFRVLPADTSTSPEAMAFVSDQLESEPSCEASALLGATCFVSDQLESEDPRCDTDGESPNRRPRPPSARECDHGDNDTTMLVASAVAKEGKDGTLAISIPQLVLAAVPTPEQSSTNGSSGGGSSDRDVNAL